MPNPPAPKRVRLAPQHLPDATAAKPALRKSSPPLPTDTVEELFERMHAAYGMRFVDMWDGQPVENVKAAWADTLAGFSYAELMRGLDNLPAKWPPDAVEFAALCRPRLGEPEALFFQALELQRLRHQGIDVRWPSATLFWAASIIGLDLQQYPYQVLKGRWLAALRQATDDVAEGRRPNHVPPPYTALPAPGCAITDTETAKKRLAEIKKLLK